MNGVPRIHLIGATGRTGNAVAHALAVRTDVSLVTCIAPSLGTTPTRAVPADVATAATATDIDAETLRSGDVVVDLGIASQVADHLAWALEHNMHAVVGTTGCDEDLFRSFGERFADAGRALLVIPNFSIGAVLMMRVAADIARFMPSAEVVEVHHDTKVDAPSGTALRTARLIAAASPGGSADTDHAQRHSARGQLVDGVPVHSLRLPGATAHQDVIFGMPGELLTIRHDAIDRSCYGAGVARAAHAVASCTGLHIGLEEFL